jgi:nicotinamidase-related amidase
MTPEFILQFAHRMPQAHQGMWGVRWAAHCAQGGDDAVLYDDVQPCGWIGRE